MQILIEIPKEYYEALQEISDDNCIADMLIIKYGKPLPEHHSDLIERSSLDVDNLDRAYGPNCELDFGRLYTQDVIEMIERAPTIIPATKEDCALTDCKCNDNGKCIDGLAYKESCYDCYQPATKEGE